MKSLFNQNFKYLVDKCAPPLETIAIRTGIDKVDLSDYYNDYNEPDLESALILAHFFKVPIETFLLANMQAKGINSPISDLRFLVLDVDGVMTDGGIIYTENGDEIKKFNAKDGLAIIRLIAAGKQVGFLSSGFTNKIIEHRAKVLGVQHVYIGTWNKLEILTKWCDELGITLENVAYIGDDLNDLAVIEKVGFSACPADAAKEVIAKVDIILKHNGGAGCVREFIDKYLSE